MLLKRNRLVWLLPIVTTLALVIACTPEPTPTQPQATPTIAPPRQDAVRVAKNPVEIPPSITRSSAEHVVVKLEVVELVGQLSEKQTYKYWTFGGTVPGPMLRVREGDTVDIVLHNRAENGQIHSIDLHSATGPGGGGVVQVAPGETKAFRFKALNPGVYIYHCASPYVPTHLANGQYGLIVVEPKEGLPPVDREFYIVQGEIYSNLDPKTPGHATFDEERLRDERPSHVVFNGQFHALTGEYAIKAEVGDRVRIFVGSGVGSVSSFHVIGAVFDRVYPEGASEYVTNVQTTLVPAGGASMVEFEVLNPGAYPIVDHNLERVFGKGALAVIQVTGPERPDVFRPIGLEEVGR